MNAEGVYHLQPRVARVARLPWVMSEYEIPTLKGLRKAAPTGVELVFTNMNRSQPNLFAILLGLGSVLS